MSDKFYSKTFAYRILTFSYRLVSMFQVATQKTNLHAWEGKSLPEIAPSSSSSSKFSSLTPLATWSTFESFSSFLFASSLLTRVFSSSIGFLILSTTPFTRGWLGWSCVWVWEGSVKSLNSNSEPWVSAPKSTSSVSRNVRVCEAGPYESTVDIIGCENAVILDSEVVPVLENHSKRKGIDVRMWRTIITHPSIPCVIRHFPRSIRHTFGQTKHYRLIMVEISAIKSITAKCDPVHIHVNFFKNHVLLSFKILFICSRSECKSTTRKTKRWKLLQLYFIH